MNGWRALPPPPFPSSVGQGARRVSSCFARTRLPGTDVSVMPSPWFCRDGSPHFANVLLVCCVQCPFHARNETVGDVVRVYVPSCCFINPLTGMAACALSSSVLFQ
jgi:hypothetical protein